MDYVTLKWLHIMSSTFLFGTGVGSAFYLLFATMSHNVRAIAVVTRCVVLADWLFTTTTVVLQPLTGYFLMRMAGFPVESRWLLWSIALYALAVACWLPVVWLQIRMRAVARAAADNDMPLPMSYWRYFSIWFALGIPAFAAFVSVFYLMVVKPV
jgi:uncharacterized membrane protein